MRVVRLVGHSALHSPSVTWATRDRAHGGASYDGMMSIPPTVGLSGYRSALSDSWVACL